MKVKSESEVALSYSTRRDPMDCSLPGSSIHGIFTITLAPKITCINGLLLLPLEKAMAPHSSTLAWKILWAEEPGGLWSLVLQKVRRD